MSPPNFRAFVQPAPVKRAACNVCRLYEACCECPVDDGSLSTCWVCAHMIVVHEVAVEFAHACELCHCDPEDIYPASIAVRVREMRVSANIPATGYRRVGAGDRTSASGVPRTPR